MTQMPRRMEALYKIAGTDIDFLTVHPPPNSVVVKSTQFKSRIRPDSTPMNKGKKLDTIGKRQYSYSTFTLRVANYLAAMGAYQRHLWNKILPLFSELPEDVRKKADDIHKEAMALSRQERIPARHVVDASARQASTSVALRRHAWLRSSTLPEDIRLHIEDMPFDGLGLFDVKTDAVLNEHQKMKKTAKTYSSQTSYRPFKQPWR